MALAPRPRLAAILLLGLLALLPMVPQADTGAAEQRSKLEALRSRISGLRSQMQSTSGEKNQLSRQLQESEKQIGRLARKLRVMDGRLARQRKRIEALRSEQAAQQQSLEAQRHELARQVRAACEPTSSAIVGVAELDARIVGFVTCYANEQSSIGEIGNNAVHPDAQGRGIGPCMYEYAFARLRERGMRYVKVCTGGDPSHAPARRAYEVLLEGPVAISPTVLSCLYEVEVERPPPILILSLCSW